MVKTFEFQTSELLQVGGVSWFGGQDDGFYNSSPLCKVEISISRCI